MHRPDMQPCIDACLNCSQACYRCLDACLNEPDAEKRIGCIKLLMECARTCETEAAIMGMNGQTAKQYSGVCASLCDQCTDACERFEDEHCQNCAAVCRDCADKCREMAKELK